MNLFVQFVRWGAGVSFAVLISAVLVQVVGRTIGSSPVWTEELTRYALLYMAAFGAGLSFRSGDLVNVDVVCEFLPGNWPRRFRLLSASLTALLCGFLMFPAWKYVSIGRLQTSPAMGLRMTYVHLSIFVLLAILTIFAAYRVVAMSMGADDGLPDARKEES